MYALFEDTGKYQAGRILSETDASAQIELDSGKRVKAKAAQVLLRFAQPAPQQLLDEARRLSSEIEPELAWEFAPEQEFGYAELCAEYFGAQASPAQQAAMLLALFGAPHYFRRAGKGRFRKASADIVAQALAAIEKKKLITAQIAHMAQELAAGVCPPLVRENLYKILFKPDKNAPEYKAVVDAARAAQMGALALLIRAGAIDSPYQFHWRRFMLEYFPKGSGFAPLEAPAITETLPMAPVQAFSIDDSATTEIDDALSLQGLGSGRVQLGIHIAAPALAIAPGSALDAVARSRLSTVYMPGHKITMLPDAVVQRYTLLEGRSCPAVSLYVTLDEATLEVLHSETRLEQVPIEANLRHDQIDSQVSAEWLGNPAFEHENTLQALSGKREPLSFLYRLARHLKTRRELVRGKPETFNRPDYNFRLATPDAQDAPRGDETVHISVRQRGAPLDLIVSETMILANSTWGAWMAELGVPAIYRSQAALAPGIKVRMGTRALPHAGMGVKSYAWSSSPLRRYVDLVNQWQIIACARFGQTAALAAPFKPKDTALLAIISAFDAAYSAYNDFQAGLERYWTLQYLRQNQVLELDANVLREGLARAETLPLVFALREAGGLERGARVRVRLEGLDLLTLDLYGHVLERLDQADAATAQSVGEGDLEDEGTPAGALALAVDLSEDDSASPDGAEGAQGAPTAEHAAP